MLRAFRYFFAADREPAVRARVRINVAVGRNAAKFQIEHASAHEARKEIVIAQG